MEECRKYILSCHLDHQQILCLILRIRIPQQAVGIRQSIQGTGISAAAQPHAPMRSEQLSNVQIPERPRQTVMAAPQHLAGQVCDPHILMGVFENILQHSQLRPLLFCLHHDPSMLLYMYVLYNIFSHLYTTFFRFSAIVAFAQKAHLKQWISLQNANAPKNNSYFPDKALEKCARMVYNRTIKY